MACLLRAGTALLVAGSFVSFWAAGAADFDEAKQRCLAADAGAAGAGASLMQLRSVGSMASSGAKPRASLPLSPTSSVAASAGAAGAAGNFASHGPAGLIASDSSLSSGSDALAGAAQGPREVTEDSDTSQWDCDKYPGYCSELLNCKRHSRKALINSTMDGIVQKDGRPNLSVWCLNYPRWHGIVENCFVHQDLKANAEAAFQDALAMQTDVDDASYCYLAGLWNDTSVTESTTREDMVGICDARFGDAWKKIGLKDMSRVYPSDEDGVLTRDGALISAMSACTTGTYHCDVMYCKEIYVKKEEYSKRFAHLAYEESSK